MADKIRIRRGLEADIPTLDTAELGFSTDSQKLYIGSDSGNLLITGLIGDTDFTVDGYVNPDADNTYGLGTPVARWAHVSLGPSSLHITSTAAETGGESYDWLVGMDAYGNLSVKQSINEYFTVDLDHGLTLNEALTLRKISTPSVEAGIAKLYYNTSDGKLHFIDETASDIELGPGLVTSVNGEVGDVVLSATDVGAISTTEKGIPLGVATLDISGKVNTSQIPAIAITETSVVGSQAAMLGLTAQTGDVAVRTDEETAYILAGTDPSILAHWTELLHPTDTVLSVNGQTGVVVLDTDDITEASNLYYTEARVTANATVTANTAHRNITASNPHGTDLGNLGSGTLSELNAAVTDATLDDSSDPRDPNAHASTHEDGGTDELTVQNLGSGAAVAGKLLESDGSGGWTLVDSIDDLPSLDTAVGHILDAIDGYALEVDLQSHIDETSTNFKAILDIIDGYATDAELAVLDAREATHNNEVLGHVKAITDVIDGYGLATDLNTVINNEAVHTQESNDAFKAIFDEIDGYATDAEFTILDNREATHNDEVLGHIKAVTDIIDGYATDAELTILDNREATHNSEVLGHIKAVTDIIDGYALDIDLSALEESNRHILGSVDGYAADVDVTALEVSNKHVLSVLDGYATSDLDEQVKVSSNDQFSGFLFDKIVAGSNVLVVQSNDGYNEFITISATGGGGGGGAASGAAGFEGQVQFNAGDGYFGASSNFFWDDVLDRLSLGVGTDPDYRLDVRDSSTPARLTTVMSGDGFDDIGLLVERENSTPIVGDSISIGFQLMDSNNILRESGRVESQIEDTSVAAIDASLGLYTVDGGTEVEAIRLTPEGHVAFPYTSTPSGLTSFGKVYPKSTDRLYFATEEGAERLILFSTDIDGYAQQIDVDALEESNRHLLDAVDGYSSGDTVKVSSNDTTADYLFNKIVAGSNVTVVESNDGGNETLIISSTGGGGGGGGDGYLTRVSVGDQVSGFLDEKLVPGDHVELVILNDDADEELEVRIPVISDILTSLDGYGTANIAPGTLDGYALKSDLDAYEPEANLDNRVTDIQLALDGYGTADIAPGTLDGYALTSDLDAYEPEANLDNRVTDIQIALDGYGTAEIPPGTLDGYALTTDLDAYAPVTHASTHEDGGSDELTVQNLGSGAIVEDRLLVSDGSGGWTTVSFQTMINRLAHVDGYLLTDGNGDFILTSL